MSSPPEEDSFWKEYSDFFTASTSNSSSTGNYKDYIPQSFYEKIIPDVHEYKDKRYEFNWDENPFLKNPCTEIELRGSMGTFTNTDAVKEVKEEETPEEELQYFDPKDLDI